MKSYLFNLRILACLTIFLATFGLTVKADTNTDEPNTPAKKLKTQSLKPKTIKVAVTVNGVDITESQIETYIKPQLEKMAKQLPPPFVEQYKKQMMQQALESMIAMCLLDGKVREASIEVTEEEATEKLKEMASAQKPPLSLEDIKALVERSGQSLDEVKNRIRKQLGYEKLMEAQFAGKINFTEDDAKKYYSENTKKFETPEQVRASHILIKPDTTDPNTDPNKAKARAQELLKQIKDGADFATLARASSSCPSAAKGGDLGLFARGQMAPPFEKAAFELKVGQVSDIVKTRFGYHIIKVADHRDARLTTFEQAKDDIIKMLTQKKQAELAKEYIESLKAEADIVYSDPVLQKKRKTGTSPAGKEP